MDNESLKPSDPLQLQQMNIYLKSELNKYKKIVDKFRENDYYSLVLRVERENVRLKSEKKDLLRAHYKLKKESEKATNDYQQVTQFHEMQREKKNTSIELLLADKKYLQKKNKRLSEALKIVQDELGVYKQVWLKPSEADYEAFIKNIENIVTKHVQETSKQVQNVVEKSISTYEEMSKSDSIRTYLVMEIEERSKEIEKLRDELVYLKEKNESYLGSSTYSLKGNYLKNNKIVDFLDSQVKKVLEQSLDFEEQFDAKLRILNDLEKKLHDLSKDIDRY